MNDPICPVCLGRSFSDFRDRKSVRCVSCQSLERHRSFWLFMLSTGQTRSNVVVSSYEPFRGTANVERRLNIEHLSSFDARSADLSDTFVFLDNLVGFEDIETVLKEKLRSMVDGGALMAFTCHSASRDVQNRDLVEILGRPVEHEHFDPRVAYGEQASEQFRLELRPGRPGKSDIFHYAKQSDVH